MNDRGESNDWVKGVRLVEANPQGSQELAFLNKHQSGNFVILEEVLYQAQGDPQAQIYWAKSVREPEREDRFINAQAEIARHLRQFHIQGIWKARHFLEIQRADAETNKLILSESLPPGKTLFQHIYGEGKTGLPEDQALHFSRIVAKTLQDLHDVGVFHWDISCKNIWITNQSDAILFDWDFAFKSTQEFLERNLWRCGTPHYLSRERLEAMELGYESSECHLRTNGFRAHEVYSLISVLAHMLMGNEFLKYGNHFGLPYNEHESLGQELRDSTNGKFDISPWLRDLLSKTFINGASPFATAQEFLTAISN
jgi:serine/threonine protein kinase